MTLAPSDPQQIEFACQAWAAEQVRKTCGHTPGEFSLIKARPWSTVWKVSASDGSYFLKACGPGFEREARLLPVLSEEFAEIVPQIVGVDEDRSWLLTRNVGRSLIGLIAQAPLQAQGYLCAVLRAYAQMQFTISKGASRLKRSDLADHSLEAMPGRLQSALDDGEMLKLGGATEHDVARSAEAAAKCRDLCRELASFGIPHSIEHGDLHPNNIMADDDAVRIIDWGDTAWSHPFCSMAICLTMSRQAFGGTIPDDETIVDAYLEPWQSLGSTADLRQALALATALRPVHGILLWNRAYHAMTGEARGTSAGHLVGWLREF